MSIGGTDNGSGNDDDNCYQIYLIIFAIKYAKLCVPVVTLSAKDNQKLSKLLSKGFETSVYWNKYKSKCDNKNAANEFKYLLELFVLVYLN